MSLIVEGSDPIKDHVSAGAAASANKGLSSVEGGVYAYILILVCTVLLRCKIPLKCWLLIVTITPASSFIHEKLAQQVGVLLKFFSCAIPDVLEESGLTQVCAPRPQCMQQEELETMFQLELLSWKHTGMSHTTGTLQWRATNFSEEIDWAGAGVALSDKEWADCEGLFLRQIATNRLSLWVKVKDHTSKGHLMGGIYYRCLARGNLLLGPLGSPTEALGSQALILMEDFNHPAICWQSNAAGCRQSRGLLECIKG